jgi:hypothetical protein
MEEFKLASVRSISLYMSERAKAEQIVRSKGQIGRLQGNRWMSKFKGEPVAGSRRPDSGPNNFLIALLPPVVYYAIPIQKTRGQMLETIIRTFTTRPTL